MLITVQKTAVHLICNNILKKKKIKKLRSDFYPYFGATDYMCLHVNNCINYYIFN